MQYGQVFMGSYVDTFGGVMSQRGYNMTHVDGYVISYRGGDAVRNQDHDFPGEKDRMIPPNAKATIVSQA